jgi:hypothetical protein
MTSAIAAPVMTADMPKMRLNRGLLILPLRAGD